MKQCFITLILIWLISVGSNAQNPLDNVLSDVSQSVQVTVTVNKKARINMIRTIDRVVVRSADSAKGYLDIPSALHLVVWCNSKDGVTIEASLPRGIIGPENSRIPRGMLLYKPTEGSNFMPFTSNPSIIFNSYVKETARDISFDLRILLPDPCRTGEYIYPIEFIATPK